MQSSKEHTLSPCLNTPVYPEQYHMLNIQLWVECNNNNVNLNLKQTDSLICKPDFGKTILPLDKYLINYSKSNTNSWSEFLHYWDLHVKPHFTALIIFTKIILEGKACHADWLLIGSHCYTSGFVILYRSDWCPKITGRHASSTKRPRVD